MDLMSLFWLVLLVVQILGFLYVTKIVFGGKYTGDEYCIQLTSTQLAFSKIFVALIWLSIFIGFMAMFSLRSRLV